MTRWARFATAEGRIGFGVLDGDALLEHEGDIFASPRDAGRRHALAAVRLLPPVAPGKIVALWNNFHAGVAKSGKPAPTRPLFLLKPPSSLAGPGDAIRRPTGYGGKIAYEGELGIVIGRVCRDVPLEKAREHVLGFTCVNDVSAFDFLNENPDFPQWTRAKGFDTFGIIGPAIATDLDLGQARVITRMDGVERQNYPVSDMVFPPLELVSRLSYDMTLNPGDVIACGTSVGVGSIKEGATVEITIEGIGTLSNTLPKP